MTKINLSVYSGSFASNGTDSKLYDTTIDRSTFLAFFPDQIYNRTLALPKSLAVEMIGQIDFLLGSFGDDTTFGHDIRELSKICELTLHVPSTKTQMTEVLNEVDQTTT